MASYLPTLFRHDPAPPSLLMNLKNVHVSKNCFHYMTPKTMFSPNSAITLKTEVALNLGIDNKKLSRVALLRSGFCRGFFLSLTLTTSALGSLRGSIYKAYGSCWRSTETAMPQSSYVFRK